MPVFEAFQSFAANLKGILWSSLIIEPRSTSCQAYNQFWLHILSLKNKRYWSFARLLTCESWSWGLVAFIITLMWCRESIFVEKSTIDFPNFLLFFNTKFPIFPIFSILSFLFYYLLEQPCRWTPCSKETGAAVKFFYARREKTLGPRFLAKTVAAKLKIKTTTTTNFNFLHCLG